MSEDNILRKILRLFTGGKRSPQSKPATPPDSALMSRLVQMVENTDEVELGCDEVFDLLDVYAEAEARGEDVAALLPLVKRHLDKCRDCHEEYEALLRIIEATS
jgi:uncharacterized protein (UPF0335 family)